MLTLSAFALAGACSPSSDGTSAAPLTTGVQVSTSLGATASTADPTSTGSTGGDASGSSGSQTASSGDASTGPAPTCPVDRETTCEPSRAPWCDEVLGLFSPLLQPLYQDALRAQCDSGGGACAVCFNGANLCVQLQGGDKCAGLEQTCRCLADARGLL
jgi:hypothetical protein